MAEEYNNPLLVELSEEDRKALKSRLQHGRVQRYGKQILDSAGERGSPLQAEGLLARMERRGDIDSRMRQAGERFQELFWKAHLDPLKAADIARVPISGMSSSAPSNRIEAARTEIAGVMAKLGGMGAAPGSCAWFVLGCEYPIAQFAARMNWRGQEISPEVAKGILVGVLAVLVVIFGL